MNLKFLSQNELDQRMKTLAQKERDVLHEILLTIKEIDSRRIYLQMGFSSLFEYLVAGVGYSEGSAQRRIDAARLLKELPDIAEKIQAGEIKLNQIALLQRAVREVSKSQSNMVTAEDKLMLLNQIGGMNHSDSQKEIALYFDIPVVAATAKKIQADESVRLEMTLSKEVYEKLKTAQALLSHSVPSGDLVQFLEYVVDRVIKQKTSVRTSARGKDKVGKIKSASLGSTAIVAVKSLSVSVKKEILKAQKCCQYRDPVSNRLCGSKWFTQVDHKHSRWAGGSHESGNLQILCARHNKAKYLSEAGIRSC